MNWKSAIGNWQCAMSCDEIQQSLSLYVDDGLKPAERVLCYRPLEVCPVGRARLAEMRSIRSGLEMLSRPAPPVDLAPSIKKALINQAAARRSLHQTTFGDVVSGWLQPVTMRYVFSSLASVIIFGCVFAAMRPQMVALHEAAEVLDQGPISIEPAGVFRPGDDINKPISSESYADLRVPFNTDPRGLKPGAALQ